MCGVSKAAQVQDLNIYSSHLHSDLPFHNRLSTHTILMNTRLHENMQMPV